MKNQFLTVGQLDEALKQNKYLLCRFPTGQKVGINCGVARIARRKRRYKENQPTQFVGFVPCNFQEYITYKIPFL